MKCRNCNAEIADKALICYRCGTATTEAKYKPVPLQPQSSRGGVIASVLVIVAVTLAALYLQETSASEPARLVAWIGAALVALVVVVRGSLRGRRSRRHR
jgi:hypothetical protein